MNSPLVVVIVEGGVVQNVMIDQIQSPIKVVVVDYDTESEDPGDSRLVHIPQDLANTKTEPAFAYEVALEENPGAVAQIFGVVKA